MGDGAPLDHSAGPGSLMAQMAYLDVEDGAASPKAVLPATGSSVKALVLRQD